MLLHNMLPCHAYAMLLFRDAAYFLHFDAYAIAMLRLARPAMLR